MMIGLINLTPDSSITRGALSVVSIVDVLLDRHFPIVARHGHQFAVRELINALFAVDTPVQGPELLPRFNHSSAGSAFYDVVGQNGIPFPAKQRDQLAVWHIFDALSTVVQAINPGVFVPRCNRFPAAGAGGYSRRVRRIWAHTQTVGVSANLAHSFNLPCALITDLVTKSRSSFSNRIGT